MAFKAHFDQKKKIIALALIAGVLLSACNAEPSTPSESSETSVTETAVQTSETTTEPTETTAITTTTETTEETEESSETSEEEENTEETAEEPSRDIGYGPYGFLLGDMRLHSQNDISMMIQPEDATVYDFNARTKCDWIDAYYIDHSFDMTEFDASYRFLGFYNSKTSISFESAVAIGSWTTPKGSNLELYITGITIISKNLVIKILPKDPENIEKYNVSINGRGYYASVEQLQMADFFLSYLKENPGSDPLEGIVEAEDHTYYF